MRCLVSLSIGRMRIRTREVTDISQKHPRNSVSCPTPPSSKLLDHVPWDAGVEYLLILSRVLDAPGLRDDFYCSIMDYSKSCHTLAVGLGNLLYGWSEAAGVTLLNAGAKDGSWLTSVAFSSEKGGKSILAFGRSNGCLSLMSLFDSLLPRFEAQQPTPVACLCWRPAVTMRPSLNSHHADTHVATEDLLVGDEMGDVYYYSVEWPEP